MARTTELLPTGIDGVVRPKDFDLSEWRFEQGPYVKDQRVDVPTEHNPPAVGAGERAGKYEWTFLPGYFIAAAMAGCDF